jgi:uncharacterized protein YdeI (YjbR/CyaY-like superfamily)
MKATGTASRSRTRVAKARTIAIPKDLRAALSRQPALDTLFSTLPYSHKREYINWIHEARRPETRRARIAKTLKMLAETKSLRGRR